MHGNETCIALTRSFPTVVCVSNGLGTRGGKTEDLEGGYYPQKQVRGLALPPIPNNKEFLYKQVTNFKKNIDKNFSNNVFTFSFVSVLYLRYVFKLCIYLFVCLDNSNWNIDNI